jgi:hypothetical protein
MCSLPKDGDAFIVIDAHRRVLSLAKGSFDGWRANALGVELGRS